MFVSGKWRVVEIKYYPQALTLCGVKEHVAQRCTGVPIKRADVSDGFLLCIK